MISTTLSLWGKGSVTLPKKWRDKYPTTNFLAVETKEGLLIKPITEIEYYEYEGGFGLRIPSTMDPHEFLRMFREASDKIDLEERAKRVRKAKKKHE